MRFRLMGITDLSTIDWPGRLAAVVFLQGCNLRCPWCQNVDGVDPAGGREAEVESTAGHLRGLKPMIDSLVLTGGEPLLQPEASLELLRAAKNAGLSCAVETNATEPKALRRLLPHLDFIAIDVKAPLGDPNLYARVVGVKEATGVVKAIEESLKIAIASGVPVEARTTVVPTLNDDEKIIERLAEDVRGVGWLRLQQFRNLRTLDPRFQELPPPPKHRLLELARVAKSRGVKVRVFTVEGGPEEV